MEDEGTKAQVEGKQDDLVEENPSSVSETAASSVDQVKGKQDLVDENPSSASANAASVEGKPDLVEENPSSASATAAASVKGKRPFEEIPSSASATAASGTKTEVEGSKRPCVRNPEDPYLDHAHDSSAAAASVMDDSEEMVDLMEDGLLDGGYLYRFEDGKLIVIGELPKAPGRMRMGPPHPNALTFAGMTRRLAETGLGYISGDDPFGKVPWNPFPVKEYKPPSPLAYASDTEDQVI